MNICQLALVAALATPASAQLCSQDIDPPAMPSSGENFGRSVGLDGAVAAVGAPGNDTVATDAGSVTLYALNPVTGRLDFDAVLTASDGEAGDRFGESVAVSGEVVVVGAPGDDDLGGGAGSAYVFRRNAGIWSQEAKLMASAPTASAGFGRSVDVDVDRLVIGQNDTIYVFGFDGTSWIQDEALATLGYSVAVDGDYVVGVREIFRFDSFLNVWIQEDSLSGRTAGHSVSIVSNLVAYISTGSSVRLRRRDAATGTWVGAGSISFSSSFPPVSVAIHNGDVLAGYGGGSGSLRRYQFTGGTWGLVRSFSETEYSGTHRLGASVAAQGDHILTGAYNWGARGRVYWYDASCDPVSATSCYQSAGNSSGATGRLDVLGSVAIVDNDVTVVASLLPENSFGFFLASRTPGLTTSPGTAQGNLCLAGNIGRYVGAGQIKNTGAVGRFELVLDVTMMPTPTGFISASAGEYWYFQAWHRDLNPGLVSNFTDAARIRFQ